MNFEFNISTEYTELLEETAQSYTQQGSCSKAAKVFKCLQKINQGSSTDTRVCLDAIAGEVINDERVQNRWMWQQITRNADTFQHFLYSAQNSKQLGDYENAQHLLKIGQHRYPNELQLILEEATVRINMHAYEEAIQILSSLVCEPEIKAQPEQNFVALYNLGVAYEETDALDAAVTHYEQALLIDSEDEELLTQLAGVHNDLGNRERAIDLFESMMLETPTEKTPYISLATIHFSAGDRYAAEEMIQRILDLHAGDLVETANIYCEWSEVVRGFNYDIALKYANLAENANPKNNSRKANLAKARALCGLGQFAEAILEFDLYIERHPSDHEVIAERGTAYFENGMHEKGIAALESAGRIAKKQQDKAKHALMLAMLHYRLNEFEAAEKTLETHSVHLNQYNLGVKLFQANLFARRGKITEAIRSYSDALESVIQKHEARLTKVFQEQCVYFNRYLKYASESTDIRNVYEVQPYLQKRIAQLSHTKDMQSPNKKTSTN